MGCGVAVYREIRGLTHGGVGGGSRRTRATTPPPTPRVTEYRRMGPVQHFLQVTRQNWSGLVAPEPILNSGQFGMDWDNRVHQMRVWLGHVDSDSTACAIRSCAPSSVTSQRKRRRRDVSRHPRSPGHVRTRRSPGPRWHLRSRK